VVFLSGNESVRVFFLSFVNIYIAIRGSIIKRGVGIPLTGLTPPYVCACPKPGPGFPASYVVVFFMFSDLR
jgi:hypothetical protein